MDPTERRPWSELPPEILSMIGGRLDTRMDVLRFRGVCSSFRSSITPLRRQAALLRLRNPRPQRPAVFLRASTVCALETPRARWLLKLEESEPGRMRILSLFSRRRIAYLPREFPMVLDSLQFRIVEICRQYTLDDGCGTGGLFPDVQKVVMHPDSVWSDLDQCLVYFIDGEGQLGYWKYGDENWSYLDDPPDWGGGCDDIVVYEGKVCVVDWSGSVWQIDSSFRLQSFFLPISCANCCGGGVDGYWKHLVVSSGDLYVVDRYIGHGANESAENMRVYRLDRRCDGDGRWEEVRSLGNSAFFLSKHCSFAVPARELVRLAGDCIYYSEEAHSIFSREDVKVFRLADGGIRFLKFSDYPLGMMVLH